MTEGAPIPGSCLCGAVRFEAAGPFQHVHHCHCARCRKHHGSLFATWVLAPFEGFRYLSGEKHIRGYAGSPQWTRHWCEVCASVLPTLLPEYGVASFPAGNLTADAPIRPEAHLFAASRAPWYEITDGLPQFEAYPPDVPAGIDPLPSLPTAAPPAGGANGSCLCGAVAWEYEGRPTAVRNCHCSRCRRARSAAHATNVFVDLARFSFTRGGDRVSDFHLPGARYFGVAFCRDCGGAVPRRSEERSIVTVPAGSLDSDPGARPACHIFVGSKANWFEITDDLPRYAELPPR